MNGAKCLGGTASANGYQCDCPTGFSGVTCETLTNVWHVWRGIDFLFLAVATLSVVGYLAIYWKFLNDMAPEPTASGRIRKTRSIDSVASGYESCCTRARIWFRQLRLRTAVPMALVPIAWLAIVLYSQLASPAITMWVTALMYSAAALALIIEVKIATYWHRWRTVILPSLASAVGTGAFGIRRDRLRRGAAVPLLAMCATLPAAIVNMLDPNALSPPHIDTVSNTLVVYGWHPLSFSVLVPALPVAIVLARVYTGSNMAGSDLVTASLHRCGVHRDQCFIQSQRGFALLSGLLFPLFWIPYLANEQQEFLADKSTTSSVDGVRALGPVVCTLNFAAVSLGGFMIASFPAPQVSDDPFVFFGLVWCTVVTILLLGVTLVFIYSLSEPRSVARKRQREKMCACSYDGGWQDGQEVTLSVGDKLRTCCSGFAFFVRSWDGQTILSGVNHCFAVGLFGYGLLEFRSELTRELNLFLWTGIVFTIVGLITSGASLFQRWYPSCKLTPTDDSFRVACVLKAMLVMTKAMLVYELAKVDIKSSKFESWATVVTYVCVASLLILGLLTLALDAHKVWKEPKVTHS